MTHHVTCHVTCSLTDSVSVSEGAGLGRTCQQKTFYFSNASPCALRQQFNIKSIFNDRTLALGFFCLHKRWLIEPGGSLQVLSTSWHHVSKTAKGQNSLKCWIILSLIVSHRTSWWVLVCSADTVTRTVFSSWPPVFQQQLKRSQNLNTPIPIRKNNVSYTILAFYVTAQLLSAGSTSFELTC